MKFFMDKNKTEQKRKIDMQKLLVRIMASILAVLMVLGIGGTLLFYLIAM